MFCDLLVGFDRGIKPRKQSKRCLVDDVETVCLQTHAKSHRPMGTRIHTTRDYPGLCLADIIGSAQLVDYIADITGMFLLLCYKIRKPSKSKPRLIIGLISS
jgi:hypothetical protein